jgi:hypothetical protein
MASTAVFDRAKSGHDHDRRLRILAADGGQQLQAVHLWQAQVGEHQVGPIGYLHGFLGRAHLIHFKAGGRQLQFENAAEFLFVLDHQDASLHGSRFVFHLSAARDTRLKRHAVLKIRLQGGQNNTAKIKLVFVRELWYLLLTI